MTDFLDLGTDVSGSRELIRVCESMLIDVRFPDHLCDAVLDAWLRGMYV